MCSSGTVFIFSGIELSPQQIAGICSGRHLRSLFAARDFRVVRPYVVLGLIALVWAGSHCAHQISPNVAAKTPPTKPTAERTICSATRTSFSPLSPSFCTWERKSEPGAISFNTFRTTHIVRRKNGGVFPYGHAGRFRCRTIRFFLHDEVRCPEQADGRVRLDQRGLVSVGVFFPGRSGLWAIFLTSFFMSLMFPTIFALGLKGLGDNTKIAGVSAGHGNCRRSISHTSDGTHFAAHSESRASVSGSPLRLCIHHLLRIFRFSRTRNCRLGIWHNDTEILLQPRPER